MTNEELEELLINSIIPNIARYLDSNNVNPVLVPIVYHQVDEWVMNAKIECQFYGLHISRGTLMYLNNLTVSLLSSNLVFPDIGHSDSIIKLNSFGLYDVLDLEDVNPELIFDIERQQLQKLVFSAMLKILILHECTHIIHGHLKYLVNNKLTQKDLPPLDSQTLELDADCIAISALYHQLFSDLKEHPTLFPVQLRSETGMIKLLGYSANFVLQYLVGVGESNLEKLVTNSHYTNAVKYNLLCSTLVTLMDAYNPGLSDDLSIWVDFKKDGIYNSSEVIDHHSIIDDVKFAFSFEVQCHITAIAKNWENMRPKLEPYSHYKLPAINDWSNSKFFN